MDGAGPETPVTSVEVTQRCRHCGKGLEHTFIDLGMSPLCESFLTARSLASRRPITLSMSAFAMHVGWCNCPSS